MPIRPVEPQDAFAVSFRAARAKGWPEWRDMYEHGPTPLKAWVRFHDLPQSKRYPETDAEDRTVVRRKRAVISALVEGHPRPLWVVTEGYGRRRRTPARPHPYLRRAMGEPRWVGSEITENSDVSSWATTMELEDPALDAVILAVSDDLGGVSIWPADFSWKVRLYDGGCDVYVATREQRDALATRFETWLAPEYFDRSAFE